MSESTQLTVGPRLSGFAVRGFRDIRQPLFIGPWNKINILGGANNAGKSAILDAIRSLLESDDRSHLMPASQKQRARLDTPLVMDGEIPNLEVGFCIDFGVLGVARGLVRAVTGRDPAEKDLSRLQTLLNQPIFQRSGSVPEMDPNRIWVWSGATSPAEQLPERVESAIEALSVHDIALTDVTRATGYSGTISWGAVLEQVIRSTPAPSKVLHIPPDRKIVASTHREFTLPTTNGEGLPGMLLGLLAPRAEDFYAARERLERITKFVREVLAQPTAELLVPHDGTTVHVALEGRVLPLTHLGAGIEQLVLLAAICTEYQNSLILMEEPDLFLHPTLQRQLIRYLANEPSNTFIIATHSAALLDTDFAAVYRVDWSPDSGTTAALVSSPDDRASLATDLGFRASDLVQANVIIWIEGPSDRIYLKKWLNIVDDHLIEGVHYSFIMYGGRLAEHLTVGQANGQGTITSDMLDRFLEITRINRHSIFLMDSDLTSADQPLADYKVRITNEFEGRGDGFAWITCGTMIENYLELNQFIDAYRKVHSRSRPDYDGEISSHPFKGGVKQPSKVAIARAATEGMSSIPNRGQLFTWLTKADDFIRRMNGMAPRP